MPRYSGGYGWTMLTPAQLEDFAHEHIGYELDMLVGTCALLDTLDSDTVQHDAVLESFLIHARSVDDFLSLPVKNQRPNDVVARHYHAEWESDPVMPERERDLVNKFVAHLTTVRFRKQGVRVGLVMAEVKGGFMRFLRALEPERRVWFARAERALAPNTFNAIVTSTTGSSGAVQISDLAGLYPDEG